METEPLPKQLVDPDPVNIDLSGIDGKVFFSCCGENQTSEGKLTEVTCKKCLVTYSFLLIPRQPSEQLYPKGKKLRIKEDFESAVGSKKVKFLKDEIVTVGQDLHGLLGTFENQTLVEVDYPTPEGKSRIMLSPVDNNNLEEIKSEES